MYDLTKKSHRILLALDIFMGTLIFSECYPTEPISSYVWRTNKSKWVAFVDWLFGAGHCVASYLHSKQHVFDAPEYRA